MEIVLREEKAASALGWASLGLGAAMLAAPGRSNRLAGIRDDRSTRLWQRIVGAREVAAFALIVFGGGRPRTALWARVAGDAKDLALLGVAARHKRESGARLAATTVGIAAITALDAYTAARLTSAETVADEQPPDDLSKDPAYEPPEPLKAIKGG